MVRAVPLGHESAKGIKGTVRSLAVEMAPLRIKAVSPGLTDTLLIRGIFGPAGSEKLCAETAQSPPLRHVAQPEDVAPSDVCLMEHKATSGSVLFPNSGYTLY